MFELRASILHCITLNLEIAQRKNQIPIGTLDTRYRLDCTLTKLGIGQRKIFLRNLYLPAIVINFQAANERLRVGKQKRGGILRSQSRELVVCSLPDRRKI